MEFQSSLPRGERHNNANIWYDIVLDFNPRSREGSDISWKSFQIPHKNFNPRSREGSDLASKAINKELTISILAPARGATPHMFCRKKNCSISILAPARGATGECILQRVDDGISILAPARGATYACNIGYTGSQFQSSLPRGERQPVVIAPIGSQKFQSSLPRGERHVTPASVCQAVVISILAPARGATVIGSVLGGNTLFQSSLPRGERRSLPGSDCQYPRISILAPARGATNPLDYGFTHQNFNPRSREGSDLPLDDSVDWFRKFQSSLPRGERHQFSPKSFLFS